MQVFFNEQFGGRFLRKFPFVGPIQIAFEAIAKSRISTISMAKGHNGCAAGLGQEGLGPRHDPGYGGR